MDVSVETIELAVERERISGTLLSPPPRLPGVLFVHGWGGSQVHDLVRAREVAGLGCVCLTFDLRGHERTAKDWEHVNRPQNLADLRAAYDWLATRPNVDPGAIAVIGISYGGYLAALLTSERQVRWLALRSPAIYKDDGWDLPKLKLHIDTDLPAYRLSHLRWQDNRVLRACASYRGHVLLVEAEHDTVVPHAVTENYAAAFLHARSLTRRMVEGADHAFSQKPAQKAYTSMLTKWLSEMVMGAREEAAHARLREHQRSEDADAA